MPVWTEQKDFIIKRMRVERTEWEDIAAAVGENLTDTVARGLLVGARLPPPDFVSPLVERESWPAGHPATWGVIIAGTSLAGSAYPVRA